MAAPTPAVRKSALCPNWSKSGIHANESYLIQTVVNDERTLNDALFDEGTSRALRGEYEARSKAEEARMNAGLIDQVEDKSRFDVMKDYANRAVNALYKLRLRVEGDHIAKAAKNSNLPREPIAAAVLAASLYTGRQMNFRIIGDTRLHSKIVLKDRVAELSAPIGNLGTRATLAYNHAGEVCASDNGCALLAQPIAGNVSAILNSAEKGSARLVYSVSF
jgi:hypothetical protein